jgi:hypothetical protein
VKGFVPPEEVAPGCGARPVPHCGWAASHRGQSSVLQLSRSQWTHIILDGEGDLEPLFFLVGCQGKGSVGACDLSHKLLWLLRAPLLYRNGRVCGHKVMVPGLSLAQVQP